MKEPRRVDVEDGHIFHSDLLQRFGGLRGVRDEGLLESPLNRPRQLVAHGSPSLFDLAAAYAYGIVRNHPFLDGSKRAGFMAAALFLEYGGESFQSSGEEVVVQTLGLAAGAVSEAAYARWLRASCQSRKKRPKR